MANGIYDTVMREQEIREEAEEKGREKGRAEGIRDTVTVLKELNIIIMSTYGQSLLFPDILYH